MSDLLKSKATAWSSRPLGELFRIGGDQVLPMASPMAEFVHYSIPAWDATGGAAIELGSQIESNKTAITRPSVLVSKLNPRKTRVVAVPSPVERTCCSTEFICYQPKQSNEELSFWADYFASADFSARLARVAVGSTNSHTRATPKETLKWFVPEVPRTEQKKIAQVFDTLDTAIHETEAIIGKLKAVKQGLLHDLLTRGIDANGELRPPQSEAPHLYKESPLGWISREWDAVKLALLVSSIGQGWSPDCESRPADSGSWGVLKTTAITWAGYDGQENKALPPIFKPRPDLEVMAEDILITRAGPASRVGVVAYVESSREKLMISDKMYRVRTLPTELPAYIALALSSQVVQVELGRALSGMAESQTNISQAIVKDLSVLRPPLEEQSAIVDRVRTSESRIREEVELNRPGN